MQGLVHSTESFGSADGPGVRFLIFLKGCPMRCRYCHNPDTWAGEGGTMMDADALLDQAERYRGYWGPEGGITVSAERPSFSSTFARPLYPREGPRGDQSPALTAPLRPSRTKEPFFSKFNQLMDVCDLVLADIKHIDPEKHKDLTGRDNANILDCLRYMSEIGEPMWIRHVLVPEITDVDEYLYRTREFIAQLKSVERVEVLPYHTLGVFKWDELGIPYTLKDVDPPAPERVEHATKILRGEFQQA